MNILRRVPEGYQRINISATLIALRKNNRVAAIVYHELGHLLNEPIPEAVPTFLFCYLNEVKYSAHLEDEVRKRNLMQKEIFADSYANKHGYGAALISTFQKQNQLFHQKIGFYNERAAKINNNELFEGNIMLEETEGL